MKTLLLLLPLLAFAASSKKKADTAKAHLPKPAQETAVFAGGCFWCMQPPFDKLKGKGVLRVTVGYTGGFKENPTYEQVSHDSTGHREAVEVVFDPAKVQYLALLDIFWKQIDPFDAKGQFCDKGEQYTSAVFYANEAQRAAAEESRKNLSKKLKKEIVTVILPAKPFYPAEDYHQSYYEKNPIRYKYYRFSCGRDQRRKEVWGTDDH